MRESAAFSVLHDRKLNMLVAQNNQSDDVMMIYRPNNQLIEKVINREIDHEK